MQALEDYKDPLQVLRLHAYTVIADREQPLSVPPFGSHVDLDRSLAAAELDGVGEEVLEELYELALVAQHARQLTRRNLRTAILDCPHQVGARHVEDAPSIGRREGLAPRVHARIGQQVVDEDLHPVGAVHSVADELVGLDIELTLVAAGNKPGVTRYPAQTLLPVAGRHGG